MEVKTDYLKIGKAERARTLKIARELGYSKEVIEAIKNAKTTIELDNIMYDARRNK